MEASDSNTLIFVQLYFLMKTRTFIQACDFKPLPRGFCSTLVFARGLKFPTYLASW
jgi:hypothetical protein